MKMFLCSCNANIKKSALLLKIGINSSTSVRNIVFIYIRNENNRIL